MAAQYFKLERNLIWGSSISLTMYLQYFLSFLAIKRILFSLWTLSNCQVIVSVVKPSLLGTGVCFGQGQGQGRAASYTEAEHMCLCWSIVKWLLRIFMVDRSKLCVYEMHGLYIKCLKKYCASLRYWCCTHQYRDNDMLYIIFIWFLWQYAFFIILSYRYSLQITEI